MNENFLQLMSDAKAYIRVALRTLGRRNAKKLYTLALLFPKYRNLKIKEKS